MLADICSKKIKKRVIGIRDWQYIMGVWGFRELYGGMYQNVPETRKYAECSRMYVECSPYVPICMQNECRTMSFHAVT